MKKHLFYLSMALITALFSACGNGKKGVFTPTSSGRAYEILVVIDQGLLSMMYLILTYLGFPSRNVHSVLCILLRQTMTLH
jgi:hypothetical protein